MSRSPYVFFCSIMLLSNCTNAPKILSEADAMQTSFHLRYVAGKNEYELQAEIQSEGATVTSSLNKKSIESRTLSTEQYAALVSQISEFAKDFHRNRSPDNSNCKMPFMISVDSAQGSIATDGCRSEDTEGRLGRIIRDAEMLFYLDERIAESENQG